MKILLLGATGLVGKNVLAQALAHSVITGVVAPTRRPLAPIQSSSILCPIVLSRCST